MGITHSQNHIETVEKLLNSPNKARVHGYLVGNLIAETENSLNFKAYDSYNKNRPVVLKILKHTDSDSAAEPSLMHELKSPHVLELLDDFTCHGFHVLVTPYAKSGTLLDHLTSDDGITKNEAVVKRVIRQILQAVSYIHQRGFIHRDIKLNNIYIMNDDLTDPTVVVADLGLASRVGDHGDQEVVGTPVFIAPEVYEGKTYGTAIDIWSVGIVFFALLTGYSPFPSAEDDVMKWLVLHRDITYPDNIFGRYSPECLDLLRKMLTRDPECRIKASDALNHPWFTNC